MYTELIHLLDNLRLKYGNEIVDDFQSLLGTCNQYLKHRGPVELIGDGRNSNVVNVTQSQDAIWAELNVVNRAGVVDENGILHDGAAAQFIGPVVFQVGDAQPAAIAGEDFGGGGGGPGDSSAITVWNTGSQVIEGALIVNQGDVLVNQGNVVIVLGNLVIQDGDMDVAGDLQVDGSFDVDGATNFNGNTDFNGNVQFNDSNVDFLGTSKIRNLKVTTLETLSATGITLSNGGDIIMTGDGQIFFPGGSTGGINISGNGNLQLVGGSLVFSGGGSVDGDVTFEDDVTVEGDTTFEGDIQDDSGNDVVIIENWQDYGVCRIPLIGCDGTHKLIPLSYFKMWPYADQPGLTDIITPGATGSQDEDGVLGNITVEDGADVPRRTGHVGDHAWDFDGSLDYVFFPRSAIDVSEDFTLGFWFKADSTGATPGLITAQEKSGNANDIAIGLNGSNPFFTVKNTDTPTTTTVTLSSLTVNTTDWYFMVAQWDSTAQEITLTACREDVDWSSATTGSSSHSDTITDAGGNFYVGTLHQDGVTPMEYFNGAMEYLSVHSEKLADEDLEWMFNGGDGQEYFNV